MNDHEWDKTGEQCVKCGAKDWMGGECSSFASPTGSTADFLNEIQRDITGLMNELFELGYTEDGTVGQKANAIRHKLIVRKCLSR